MLTYDMAKRASSAATIRSHARHTEKPPPIGRTLDGGDHRLGRFLQGHDPFVQRVDVAALLRLRKLALPRQPLQVAAAGESARPRRVSTMARTVRKPAVARTACAAAR
jgi:hypothetical protein